MRVQQAGRLGNFLFQWVFALNLARELNRKVTLTFDKHHSDLGIFKSNHDFFQTQQVKLEYSPWTGIECKFLDFLSSKSPKLGKLACSQLKVEYESEKMHRGNTHLYRGFFQDVKFPDAVRDDALRILRSKIELVSQDSQVRHQFPVLEGPYQVIHIRLGDFKDSSFGVLKLKNQIELLKPNMNLVVCTDGTENEVTDRLNGTAATILTPRNSDPWETLDVMSTANRVFTSNSTMSWWAGYLAYHNKAEVFLPNSWRKADLPSYKLNIPGTHAYEAQFE